AMPVWAIEHEGAVYFSTGEDTVKVRNLEARPECVLTTDDADLAVIVEGTVARVEGDLEALSERYHEKYGMHFPPDSPVFRVTPRKVFGFIESPAEFGRTATRWLFDGA
nr:pyridoxamine 5'-phosphate oxidase family protein [Myxococcota bacterium]